MYKQLRFLTTMLLLAVCCGTWAQETYNGTGTFKKCTGTLQTGLYVIGNAQTTNDVTKVYAINNTTGTSWILYTEVILEGDDAVNPDASIVWKYDESTGYIQNIANNNYIYWSSGNVGCCGTTAYAHTVSETSTSGVYNVKSKATTSRVLRRNSTSGYRYYTSSTGTADICFYKLDTGGSQTETCETPTFSPVAGTYTEAQSVSISTATDGATIYYTTDGSAPTTSSNVYSTPINVASTMTINAIAVKEGYDNSEMATATYTIEEPTPSTGGTWELTDLADLTSTDVFVIVGNNGDNYAMTNDNGTGSAPSAVEVTISNNKITSEVADNIKWNISADATNGYTFYPNGSTTTWLYCTNTNNGVRVGTNTDKTFKIDAGYLKHDGTSRYVGIYNSQDWRCYTSINSNIEDQSFAFYKYVEGSDTPSTDPSIAVTPKNIQATAERTEGTINVTYNNIADVEPEIIFYEADGTTETTCSWITAAFNSDNSVAYVIAANAGEARTAYMKVYALDDNADDVYSDLITITQAEYVAPFESVTYNLANSITSGKHYIIVGKSATADYAMGVQNSNNRAAVEISISGQTATVETEDVHEVQICGPDADGYYTIVDGGYLYAASNSSNHLKTQETLNDNGRWNITFGNEGVANIVAQGTNARNIMQYNASNHIFSCYNSAQGDVYLYEKADEATPTQTVSISSVGLATFCSENALDFTGVTDVWAYIAQNNNGNVTYQRVKKVPARTGVLLRNKLEEGAISREVPVLTGSAANVSGNMFIGTLTDIDALASVEGTNTNYILNKGENGVGFYKANYKKVGAGKAYLQLPTPTEGAKTFIGFEEEGEATSISTIDNGQLTMDNAYNLQGQKVGSEYKGIVIVNGKKFINK